MLIYIEMAGSEIHQLAMQNMYLTVYKKKLNFLRKKTWQFAKKLVIIYDIIIL